jgi:type II secretory pathway pseudopilin PulG
MNNKNMRNEIKNIGCSGFTLVELIVYVGIAALSLMMILITGQNLISSNIRAQAQRELSVNMRPLMNQFTQSVRNAEDIVTASSTFNAHPGAITLDYAGSGTDVIIDTYTKDVTLSNGQIVTIRKLRIKEGALAYQDLTSDQVDVSNFVLRNLTKTSERKNINIEVTLEQLNPLNDPNYNTTISVETAISLRQ